MVSSLISKLPSFVHSSVYICQYVHFWQLIFFYCCNSVGPQIRVILNCIFAKFEAFTLLRFLHCFYTFDILAIFTNLWLVEHFCPPFFSNSVLIWRKRRTKVFNRSEVHLYWSNSVQNPYVILKNVWMQIIKLFCFN